MAKKHTEQMVTPIGTLSFVHVVEPTKDQQGEEQYSVQFIVPKSDKEGVLALKRAINKVAKAEWGSKIPKFRYPTLRDGDAEAGEPTDDGSTRGEKYPERLGSYFFSAKTRRKPGVIDRDKNAITDSSDIYSGCKGRLHVTFFPYANSGNIGIGVGLNHVQKVADGEALGGEVSGFAAAVFDDLDLDDDDVSGDADDLDDLDDDDMDDDL